MSYVCVINIVAYVMYGMDKKKAINKQWRIPEKTLLGIALIGGSVGSLLGMKQFHHKTKHPKFYIGVPVIIIIQLAAIFFLYIFSMQLMS